MATCHFCLKKSKTQRKSAQQKQNSKALHMQCLNQTYSGRKSEKKGARPTKATRQKRNNKSTQKALAKNAT